MEIGFPSGLCKIEALGALFDGLSSDRTLTGKRARVEQELN
ncbi:MAG TPA: hypothetical protein VL996_04245 [Methylocella sp.]|nr:hypothetical protein [Methylocella sp.]